MGNKLLESSKKRNFTPISFVVLALGPSKHTQRAPVKLRLHFLNIPLPPTTLEKTLSGLFYLNLNAIKLTFLRWELKICRKMDKNWFWPLRICVKLRNGKWNVINVVIDVWCAIILFKRQLLWICDKKNAVNRKLQKACQNRQNKN